MDERKIIQMIDEYLTEPHSISNEWVQALSVCKDVLFELAGCKVTIEQLKMDVESLTNERDALQEMIIEQKAQLEKKDIEIDILIRKKETLRDEIAEQKAEIERLTKIVEEQHEGSLIAMEVYKNEAIKKITKKLYEKIEQNAKFGFDYVTKKEIENVVRELEVGDNGKV